MKAKLSLVSLLVVAGALALPTTEAHEVVYTSFLSGPSESPPNPSLGTGFVTITLDLDLFTLRVEAIFSNLQGVTTASHIHAATTAPFAGTAAVATQLPSFEAFPLGVSSGTYDHTFDLTLASFYNPAFIAANGGTIFTASNALFAALDQGRAYFNIHTNTSPGGEIRGFLVVPEPATTSLLVAGGLGFFLAARKRCSRMRR